jgi:ATP-dependent DNA helicase RecG
MRSGALEPINASNDAEYAPNHPKNAPISAIQVQIMHLIASDKAMSYDDMAKQLSKDRSTIMRNVQRLKGLGYLRRIGTNRSGHWEICSSEY